MCHFIISPFHGLNFFVTLDPVQDNKKNTKRREVDNKQLKKVLSGVIEHVRIGHVLPPHSELLQGVFRRGLADRGMPLDIGEGSFYPNLPWMRRREEKDFIRPRLFLPYFEEAKVKLFMYLQFPHSYYTNPIVGNTLLWFPMQNMPWPIKQGSVTGKKLLFATH